MKLQVARTIAEGLVDDLSPHCERIAIAGSIRREVPSVKDIEIVCIPKKDPGGLFGDNFCDVVNRYEKVKGEPGGKYTQRIVQPSGSVLDLFIAKPENWGLIFAIRTGSANFSKLHLANRWVQLGYKGVDGMLTDPSEKSIPVREERDLFELLEIRWVEPKHRW